MTNAGSDTIFSFITIGGLLADESSNPAKFAVTQQDLDNGYALSNGIARAGSELAFGLATGGAASVLGKAGKAGKIAGYSVGALDLAGNVKTAGSGVANAIENGANLQNSVQMIGGALGVVGNVSGALKAARSADDLTDASRTANNTPHAKPRDVSTPPDDLYNPQTGRLKVLNEACFAPETLIATPSGPRPIGELRRGDSVLAYDHRTGHWAERAVVKFHENIYEGPLVTITTDSGPIRTTVYHPFWVLSGRDLDERSTPRELAENEDQGFTLPGRWVNSHELRCGDVLIGHDGKQRFVRKIEQEFVSGFLVHNLTIDEDHTFAVGSDAVLVHNTAKCYDDLVAEANLKYPKKAVRPPEDHHIDPQYLTGHSGGPKVKLPAAYHQEITNAFRRERGYGLGPVSPEKLQEIKNNVYGQFPLPPGTDF